MSSHIPLCHAVPFPPSYDVLGSGTPAVPDINHKNRDQELGDLPGETLVGAEKKTSFSLDLKAQALLDKAENQEKIKDFCTYVNLGYTLVSGTLAHFVGNLLIYGPKYEILKTDLSEFGVLLKNDIEIASIMAEGVFTTQKLLDVLIRKHRLTFAKELQNLIKNRLSLEKDSKITENQQLSFYLENLELFIINEEKILFQAELQLGVSITRAGLSTISYLLRRLNLTPLISAPFQWASAILVIASSSFDLHKAIQSQKLHSQWILKRNKYESTEAACRALLEKRTSKWSDQFEQRFNTWKEIPSFEELSRTLSFYGIDLAQRKIHSLEDWEQQLLQDDFKQELRKDYLANVAEDRRRADLIKELSLAKQCSQKKEVDFNTIKKKILFSVGVLTTSASVAITILIFLSILTLPGFVLGFPALVLFTATACLFFIGIHRMRTQRPIFFKHYFPLRIRYICNMVKILFKQMHLHFIKNSQRDLKRYSIDKLEKENQKIYHQLNCFKAADFLNKKFKENLKKPEDVTNFLEKHLKDLFNPAMFQPRLIKTLHKDMGIPLFTSLDPQNKEEKDLFLAKITEFLGYGEEDLLFLIRTRLSPSAKR